MNREADVDRLLAEALEQSPENLTPFLDERCGSDLALRSRLERLLRQSKCDDLFLKPGSVFEGPLLEEMIAEPAEVATGAWLGPYEIKGSIGRGGMGQVYRARDSRLERDVAIKILSSEALPTSQSLARFEREARAVAALNHPNIVAIHDVGAEGDVHYVVTELLEGETLANRLLRKPPLTPGKAVEYAIQIAHGLAAAHDRGIVHRDVKPANVFITNDGRVKLLDFGLAQQEITGPESETTDWTGFRTEPGTVLGTPSYMSPEQVLAQPATVRSDLFAFGVIVYEMLKGTHPFRGATMTETVTAILRDDALPLDSTVLHLPRGLAGIVHRCLEKRPADRPESARDVALFFEAIASDHHPEPAPTPAVAPQHLGLLSRRVFAIACGLALLLSTGTWIWVRSLVTSSAAAIVETDLVRAERLVQRVQRQRLSDLALTARLVASFPELRALFATDAPTIRDYLLSYQQRNPGSPSLVAIGPDGTVIGWTDDRVATSGGESIAALAPGQGTILQLGDRLYHAAAAVADAGGTVFGLIVGLAAIDETFAAALREATQEEIVLLSETGVLASTVRGGTPWRARGEWRRVAGSDKMAEVRLGADRMVAREVVLAEQAGLSAIVLKSRGDASASLRRIQNAVMLSGLLLVAAAVAGSAWIARLLRTVAARVQS
jgi:serine/threonine protein kinase